MLTHEISKMLFIFAKKWSRRGTVENFCLIFNVFKEIATIHTAHCSRSPLEPSQNDVRVTSAEIPYWWRALPRCWYCFRLVERKFPPGTTIIQASSIQILNGEFFYLTEKKKMKWLIHTQSRSGCFLRIRRRSQSPTHNDTKQGALNRRSLRKCLLLTLERWLLPSYYKLRFSFPSSHLTLLSVSRTISLTQFFHANLLYFSPLFPLRGESWRCVMKHFRWWLENAAFVIF